MTASDAFTEYDYEAYLAERDAARDEAEAMGAMGEPPDEGHWSDSYVEPELAADEVEAEETRQPWAATVANIRNYPDTWKPFVQRPVAGDWGRPA